MKHLRYLRYVLLHKLYVFVAGLAIWRVRREYEFMPYSFARWCWRLIVHDSSKFRPSEWGAYASYFYATSGEEWIARTTRAIQEEAKGLAEPLTARATAEGMWSGEKKERQARFSRAWLLHQHRNPHHWQFWILREDSGKTFALTPKAIDADEMLADWIGAGPKVFSRPSLAECVAMTVKWYCDNRVVLQASIRSLARERIEDTLHVLSAKYGLVDMAYQVREARAARQTVEVRP